jgi:hypothetical protein
MRSRALVVVALAPLVACSKKSEAPVGEAKPAQGSANVAPAGSGSAAPATGSAGSAAAGSAAAAAEAPADAKFCFVRVEDSYELERVATDGNAATVCASVGVEGARKTTCGTVDLTTGTWTAGKQPPEPPKPTTPLEIKQDKGAVSLCKDAKCTQLAGLLPSEEPYAVAVSADGKRAAVGGVLLGGFWTYDATTGKKLKEVKLIGLGPNEDGGACFNALAFAGELVYAATDVCAGPGADGAFYSWAGKKVAKVTTNPYGYEPLDLGNGSFAVGDLNGLEIDIVDAKTGKVRTVEITREECEDCDLLTGSPMSTATLEKLPDGKLLQVHSRGIAIVDPASAKVEKQIQFPLCGK